MEGRIPVILAIRGLVFMGVLSSPVRLSPNNKAMTHTIHVRTDWRVGSERRIMLRARPIIRAAMRNPTPNVITREKLFFGFVASPMV